MVYFVLAAWLLVVLVRVFRPPVPTPDEDGVVSDGVMSGFERWRTTFWPMLVLAVLVTLAWPLVFIVSY